MFLFKTAVAFLLLCMFISGWAKKSKNDGKRQVIVLPSKSHKSQKHSEVFVYGHDGGSGQSDEVDKETLSAVSSNVLAATNLMRSQSEVVEGLSREMSAVRTMVENQVSTINSKNAANIQELEEIKRATKNTTDVVSTLAVLWSKAEKKYVTLIKGLEKRVRDFEEKMADMEERWGKKFAQLSTDTKKNRASLTYVSKMAAKAKGKSDWPSGNYCILANYKCPPGFSRQRSYIKAVYMYSVNSKFVKGGRIGSSYIGCYGDHCGQYGSYGVVNIVGCCK